MVSAIRPDPAALVARWSGEGGTLAQLRDGENAVYRFETEGGSGCILRLTEERHRTRAQVEAELAFVRFVAARGVPAARPVPSAEGEWVATVSSADGGIWHAAVFQAVRGRHFEYHSADIDWPLFRAWGRAMGALHAASREFRPPASPRARWSAQDGTRCDAGELAPTETAAVREHALVTEWLASLSATPESWGLIHGDFERTNFVLDAPTRDGPTRDGPTRDGPTRDGRTLDGGVLRVYDFDDACYHWYVADIAHALWAFRGAAAADRRRFLAWFLEGYRGASAIDEALVEQFSWFIRLRSLSRFIGHVQGSRGAGAAAADDPWARRMRAAFAEPFRW